MATVAELTEAAEEASEDWAEELWERPAPDPERLARYRLHDPSEPSRYVRNTAHLPALSDDLIESEAFWMRLVRRASVGR